MGTIQSGINNILGAVAAATVAASSSKEKKAEEAKKLQEKDIAEAQAEQESIAATQKKLEQANQMALGYTQADLDKREAAKALGIELPNKNPRGVSNATLARRMGNLKAMEEIQAKYIQNKEFRERLANIKAKSVAAAIKTNINKKGGKK